MCNIAHGFHSLPTLLTSRRCVRSTLTATSEHFDKDVCSGTELPEGFAAPKGQPEELASARCEVAALARPRDGPWSSSRWLDTRKRLLDKGLLGELRMLTQAVQACTAEALRCRQYLAEDAVVVDLSAHLSPIPAVGWYGRQNLFVPEELVGGAGSSLRCMDGQAVEPPLVIASASVFEVISQLNLVRDEDGDRQICLAMEVSDFESDGTPSVDVLRVGSHSQQGLVLCSDFSRFVEATQRGRMRGAACTVRDHLSAAEDPYVFVCVDLTVFRGPQEYGYPFLERPCRVHGIITALPSARPALSIANTSDITTARQTEWYACESDQRALLERLNLIGLIALQEHTPEHHNSLVLVINALGCDRGLHPRDAVANSLKHWRRRFARFFHCVVIACGPDEALARHFDSVINHHVYHAVNSGSAPLFSDWHWDERYLRLHVNSVEFIRFGATCRRAHVVQTPPAQTSTATLGEESNPDVQQDSQRRRSSTRKASLIDSFSDADAILESSMATRGLRMSSTNGDEVLYTLRQSSATFKPFGTAGSAELGSNSKIINGATCAEPDSGSGDDDCADNRGSLVGELPPLPRELPPRSFSRESSQATPRRYRRQSVFIEDRSSIVGLETEKRKKSLLAQRVSVFCRTDGAAAPAAWRRISNADGVSRPLSPTKSANLRAFAAAVEDARNGAIEKFDEAVGMRLKESRQVVPQSVAAGWLSSGSLMDFGAASSQSRSQGTSRRTTGLIDGPVCDALDTLELRKDFRDRLREPKARTSTGSIRAGCGMNCGGKVETSANPPFPHDLRRSLQEVPDMPVDSEVSFYTLASSSESEVLSVDDEGEVAKEEENKASSEASDAAATEPHQEGRSAVRVLPEQHEPFTRAGEQRLRMELDTLAAQLRQHSFEYWSNQPKAGLKGLEIAFAEDRSASATSKPFSSRRRLKRMSMLVDQQVEDVSDFQIPQSDSEKRPSDPGKSTSSGAHRHHHKLPKLPIAPPVSPSQLSPRNSGSTPRHRSAQLVAAHLLKGPFSHFSRRESVVHQNFELPEDLGQRNFAL